MIRYGQTYIPDIIIVIITIVVIFIGVGIIRIIVMVIISYHHVYLVFLRRHLLTFRSVGGR